MSNVIKNVIGSIFYKCPGNIVFGAFPTKENIPDKKNQYFPTDIYRVKQYNGNGYTDYSLFFNQFYNCYCLHQSDLWPTMNGDEFNPFVNNDYGYCQWEDVLYESNTGKLIYSPYYYNGDDGNAYLSGNATNSLLFDGSFRRRCW